MNNPLADYGLRHLPVPGKTIYNAETYLNNWYEETVRNTLKREEFLKKRECEELSIQKSQIMADLLLKPAELTPRRDGYLYFGDTVQIISPGPDCPTAIQAFPFKNLCKYGHLALSSSVPPAIMDYKQYLDTDSVISASPHLFPVVRNSFVIENPDCPESNSVIHYGDAIRIRALPTQHYTLYLHSAPAIRLHAASTHSAQPLVRFSDTKNPNTLWRIVPLDEITQLKMQIGTIPIPLQTRLMIKHALSGNNLSLEPNYPVFTYFGDEHEVTVHTKFDRTRKNPTWANHWSFHTKRGWPKPDRDIVEQAKLSASINANDATSSAAETAKAEAQEKEDTSTDECLTQQSQPYCAPEQTVQQYADDQLSQELTKMRLDTGVPGHVMKYDFRTGPQPHAHAYRMSENQEFYPNKKWNCPDVSTCCYPRAPPSSVKQVCPPAKPCFDMEDSSNRIPANCRKFY